MQLLSRDDTLPSQKSEITAADDSDTLLVIVTDNPPISQKPKQSQDPAPNFFKHKIAKP